MADGSCPGEIRQPPAWHADAGRGPSTPSDPERGRVLTNEELICEHAARVGAHWSGRPCLLDPRFLGAALDASEAPAWLPALFDAVDRKRGRAIPVTDLSAQPGEVEGTAGPNKAATWACVEVTLLDLADATLANWSGNMSLG